MAYVIYQETKERGLGRLQVHIGAWVRFLLRCVDNMLVLRTFLGNDMSGTSSVCLRDPGCGWVHSGILWRVHCGVQRLGYRLRSRQPRVYTYMSTQSFSCYINCAQSLDIPEPLFSYPIGDRIILSTHQVLGRDQYMNPHKISVPGRLWMDVLFLLLLL